MTYVLDGRGIGERKPFVPDAVPEAPCIFCGKQIKHFNDEGVGWLIGAVVNGKSEYYLYCDQPPCPEATANYADIWRCGCEPDYVENVGDLCASCGCTRAAAKPVRE